MTDKDDTDVRTLRCPFCGYTSKSGGIHKEYCGPHKLDGDGYWPAVQMHEIKETGQ